MTNLIERFLTYTRFDTQADGNCPDCPSSKGQLVLAEYLAAELQRIGMQDVELDDNGYIMATLPANCDAPTIGFIAHMDTAPDYSGRDVRARVVMGYDGGDIVLNAEQNVVLSPREFPEITQYAGQDIIVTDGNSLLGADNKAGIAEIMNAMEYLLQNPQIAHGKVRVAFTVDEEIGRGANKFDVEKFGCEFAYTVDGGEIGELEYETFNAAEARLTINGRNVHPGSAKNKMINSMQVAMELNGLLPVAERPEYTEKYEGFFLLIDLHGTIEKTSMKYIIRDHNSNKFAVRKELLEKIVAFLNDKYGRGTVDLVLTDQYYNMRDRIEPVYHIVELAQCAMEQLGIKPIIKPVRGGTDGARLSFMGLPCPNIFTGGHNFHGKFEYIPVQSMYKAVETIVRVIELNAQAR